jgi:septal ring factor EnvC (AmiA/AmiB activator)
MSELEAAISKALDIRLATVEKNAQWVKWFLYGAFALGLWVGTIQIAIEQTRTDVRRIDAQLAESRSEIQRLSEDTAVIKATVLELKETMREVKADLKERN